MRQARARPRRRRVWTMPVLLAASTLIGLAVALFDADQPWRTLAWGLVALPIVVASGRYLASIAGWRRARSPLGTRDQRAT